MQIKDSAAVKAFRERSHTCEWCGGKNNLQVHHWYHRGMAACLDIPINFVCLDIFCHSREESGQIGRDDLIAVIAARERLLQPCIKNAIYLLLRLPFRTPHDVLRQPFEQLEFWGLLTSAGLPTLAGKMCGVQGRVLK